VVDAPEVRRLGTLRLRTPDGGIDSHLTNAPEDPVWRKEV